MHGLVPQVCAPVLGANLGVGALSRVRGGPCAHDHWPSLAFDLYGPDQSSTPLPVAKWGWR
jgi:hypothetical protein